MNSPHPARNQLGAVLYVALVLLVILALGALFTVQTSLSEQRAATADSRSKVAAQVAESGVDQAIEYLRMNQETILPEPGTLPAGDWTVCAATDTTFPCGAIEPSVANSATRALYYAYTGGTNDATNAAAEEVDLRSLPLPKTLSKVGDFDVSYNVGAVICPVDFETIGTSNAQCTSDPDKSNSFAVTLVSTGQIEGESARSTISVGLTQYRVIHPNPNVPPVVSSSVISGLGNATIVANPNGNSMGNLEGQQGGWPISAWSRSTIDPSGSFQTCEATDYFDSTTTLSSNGIRLCDDCSCNSLLSHKGVEGRDILDRDNGDTGVLKATDATLSPTYQFPCDLFAFTFGVDARENLKPTDTHSDDPPLCETQIDTDKSAKSATTTDIEDFLAANFTQLSDCTTLVDNSDDGGLFWIKNGDKGCAFTSGDTVGSPEHPVVLVVDSLFSNSGPTVYGVVFVRDPAKEYADAGAAKYKTGGGNGIIYGAVVIEGATGLTGGLKVISSPEIMKAIANSNNNLRLARVPGSWNDSLSY